MILLMANDLRSFRISQAPPIARSARSPMAIGIARRSDSTSTVESAGAPTKVRTRGPQAETWGQRSSWEVLSTREALISLLKWESIFYSESVSCLCGSSSIVCTRHRKVHIDKRSSGGRAKSSGEGPHERSSARETVSSLNPSKWLSD